MRLGTIKSLALDRVHFVLHATCTGGLPDVIEQFPTRAALFDRYDELVAIDECGEPNWQQIRPQNEQGFKYGRE